MFNGVESEAPQQPKPPNAATKKTSSHILSAIGRAAIKFAVGFSRNSIR